MLLCNFCGKDENDVDGFIAGPAVYICNECVTLCVEILADLKSDRAADRARDLAFAEIYGTD